MTYLINSSLQQGIFPDALKAASVTPIFKNGDPQLPSTHPVFIVSGFSKLFEKYTHSRLHSFYNKIQCTL